jgi:transcriptional regulator with XRE-family HTH domain
MPGNANSGKRPDRARQRLAARLRRRGYTLRQIGERLGVTRQAVHLLLQAYRRRQAELTLEQILALADDFRARTGRWPQSTSGRIRGTGGTTWQAIDDALRYGERGLPDNSSLAQLLAEHHGYRNPARLSRLTEAQILQWADAHRQRNGKWPNYDSGPIAESLGENWVSVNAA